ncbi:chemotaxis protein cheC [Thermococcus litoralis DSM 5473]|uniref:Chemotaxis protein cheC n=1 Tax=Thermococcus litoralis (strain ATCC 51850 / DSM 5473 / JCM 8560 / NS-C) TaxID=523849 RepID=H3ZR48_THELN|nr:chemotaxis protein CheC [Thermococcus litoralis]EHR77517.1 chemotaxis protein cheC [Thermococcus litoralis DSM 5473]
MDYEEYLKNLGELEKSALLETFNIGASHAADALSQIINKPVTIKVPNMKVSTIKYLPTEVGEDIKAIVYVGLGGDFNGHAFFVTDIQDAMKVYDIMLGQEIGSTKDMDEMVQSAIMEIGNILISAFANALSQFLGIVIEQTPPQLAIDFIPAVLNLAIVDVAQYCDYVILIGTNISVNEIEFHENFFIMPHVEDMKKIINKLMEGL